MSCLSHQSVSESGLQGILHSEPVRLAPAGGVEPQVLQGWPRRLLVIPALGDLHPEILLLDHVKVEVEQGNSDMFKGVGEIC